MKTPHELVGVLTATAAAFVLVTTPAALADNSASAHVVCDLPVPGTQYFPGDWHQVMANASIDAQSAFTVAGEGEAAGFANGNVTDDGLLPGQDASDVNIDAQLSIGFLARLGMASVSGSLNGLGVGSLEGEVWDPGQYGCTAEGHARADSSAPAEQPHWSQEDDAEMSFYEVIEPGPPGPPPGEGFALLDSVLAPDEISR